MSENTTERLREFRAQHARPKPSYAGLLIVAVLMLVVGFAAGFAAGPIRMRTLNGERSTTRGGLPASQLKQYALYLEQKELPFQAIEAYKDYLDTVDLDDAARSRVCYSIGKLAAEAAHEDPDRYTQALAFLYQAEMLDPDSDLREEIDKRVVFCLEKLGRSADLRRELRKRTAVKRTAEDVAPGEIVLAEFAGEVITDRDLDRELEKLPASVRERTTSPEQRAQFLENIVAERLLLDKAVRQGLDSDPEIERILASERDALIVRKLIADEVRAKVHVTPEDVERFYKAEPQRFTDPARAEVRVGKAAAQETPLEEIDFGNQPVSVIEGRAIPGVPGNAHPTEVVFMTEPGAVSQPVQFDGTWYRFEVLSKQPERLHSFEEVQEQAAQMLRMQKEQEQFRLLIEQTLKARNVVLYPERLAEGQG